MAVSSLTASISAGAQYRGPLWLGRSVTGGQQHHEQEQQVVEAERDGLHAEPEERDEAAPSRRPVEDRQFRLGR